MSNPQEQEQLESHFKTVASAICAKRVIPFLGAGASLCDRPPGSHWTSTENEIVPNSFELTEHLADKFGYPRKEHEELALARVSQYAAIMLGVGPLYEELQGIFQKKHGPTSFHRFLAGLPGFFRNEKIPVSDNPMRKRLIIFTTNYDDLLDRAFDEVNEPYHKLVYMAAPATYGGHKVTSGSFLHFTPDKEPHPIPVPNEYKGIEDYKGHQDVEPHPAVIINIHGAVERSQNPLGSYVITEDHYIDYLVRASNATLLNLPMSLSAAVKNSHYLFLGYSLRDWNIRVAWRRIWEEQTRDYRSWAVQVAPDLIDKLYWDKQNVEIYDKPLAEYVQSLQQYMGNYNV